EVELICDRVGILQRGEMVREGTVDSLTRQHDLVVIGLAAGQTFPIEEAAGQGYTVRPSGNLWEGELHHNQSIDTLVDLLRGRGLGLRYLMEKRQSLEDLFVQTVEAAEPGVDRPARRSRRLAGPSESLS